MNSLWKVGGYAATIVLVAACDGGMAVGDAGTASNAPEATQDATPPPDGESRGGDVLDGGSVGEASPVEASAGDAPFVCATASNCPRAEGACLVCTDGTDPCAEDCMGGVCVEHGCPARLLDSGVLDAPADVVGLSDAMGAPDGTEPPCMRSSDCPMAALGSLGTVKCAFPIAAGCAATGICVFRPGGVACPTEQPACTCAGVTDTAPQCGLDSAHQAYAWEPLSHKGACTTPGSPDAASD